MSNSSHNPLHGLSHLQSVKVNDQVFVQVTSKQWNPPLCPIRKGSAVQRQSLHHRLGPDSHHAVRGHRGLGSQHISSYDIPVPLMHHQQHQTIEAVCPRPDHPALSTRNNEAEGKLRLSWCEDILPVSMQNDDIHITLRGSGALLQGLLELIWGYSLPFTRKRHHFWLLQGHQKINACYLLHVKSILIREGDLHPRQAMVYWYGHCVNRAQLVGHPPAA